MSDLGAPATGTASASQAPDGWLSMDTAPTDGTVILGWYGAAEQERVRWAEERHCMLSTVAPGAGLFGPGWENTEGLNAEDPIAWKPATGTEPNPWPQNSPDVPEEVYASVAAEVDPFPDPEDYPLEQNAAFRSAVIVAYQHGLAVSQSEVRRRLAAEVREHGDRAVNDHWHADLCGCSAWPARCDSGSQAGQWDSANTAVIADLIERGVHR